jgi:ribonuclease HI
MFFDGASSCKGEGDGVLFVVQGYEYIIPFLYRLQCEIDYTNNLCDYEALVLGLEAARKLKIEHLIVYGDAKLIVKQTKKKYQAKNPRLRSYINLSWDLIENFFSFFNIHCMPRMENQ